LGAPPRAPGTTTPDPLPSARRRYRTIEAGKKNLEEQLLATVHGDELLHGIEVALAIGTYVDYHHGWDFVEGVEAVRGTIVPLIEEGEAARAVDLLETFIAGCYEKSEEIDGSSGGGGQFVEDLFCDWIRARQAAHTDPDETASMLVSWMQSDVYGYCHRLEKHAVKALDGKGLDAFERGVEPLSADGAKAAGQGSGRERATMSYGHEAPTPSASTEVPWRSTSVRANDRRGPP